MQELGYLAVLIGATLAQLFGYVARLTFQCGYSNVSSIGPAAQRVLSRSGGAGVFTLIWWSMFARRMHTYTCAA